MINPQPVVLNALQGQQDGHMLPWAVRDLASGEVIGRHQRTHVNTTCKLLLLAHAFDTLACKVVGLRTDGFNFRSQRAIEGLGAKKDGSSRDIVTYSILAHEWPGVRRHLETRLQRHGSKIR